MYQLGRRSRHHKLLLAAFAGIVLLSVGFGTFKLINLKTAPDAHIINSPPVITPYDPMGSAKVHIDETLFRMDLPTGWKAKGRTADIYAGYSFQSPNPGTQLLTVYIDNLPTSLAVNRVLAVQAQGSQIGHDTVSDNCVNFLPPSSLNTPQAKTQKVVNAKWQNVEFYCDVGNYQRDVVGTSSAEGINRIDLQGATSRHSLFFAFTDNGASPDYAVFYSILDNFALK